MMKALTEVLRDQPQSEPIFGRKDMVENSAGGYVFEVTKWDRLDRFLILGTEGGTYYVGSRKLTQDNVEALLDVVQEDGPRVVRRIVEISDQGRAPKNDQALFALAVCAAHGDDETKQLALMNLSKVARIGTHLFQFITFLKEMRGFGRSVKRAFSRWYLDRPSYVVASQVTKYRQRHNWSHRDVLRVAHPVTEDLVMNDIFSWITHPDEYEVGEHTTPILRDFLALQQVEDAKAAAALISRNRGLTHEMVPTQFKKKEVWAALLDRGMPMMAMIRNLPTMTRLELLTPMAEGEAKVLEALEDQESLHKARIHPIAILIAMLTYKSGRSVRGSATWDTNQNIVAALEKAFYASFKSLPKLDQRVYIGLDVSSSMTWANIMGVKGLTACVASAAMAMVLARMARQMVIYGFCHEMRELPINKNSSLSDAVKHAHDRAFGGTDCALPMIHAMEKRIPAETFVVLTDSETWAGRMHPSVALQNYRKKMNIPAKLVVLAATSTGFTIADPRDAGMLDIAGFDNSVPRIVEDFIS